MSSSNGQFMKTIGISVLLTIAVLQNVLAEESLWLTDLAKAKTKAKEENKLVLMDFTGSDWCPGCKELHKSVLSNKDFEDFAKKNLVLLLVDFPQQKKLPEPQRAANDALAEKFNIEGFPTLVVLNSEGKQILKDEGYSGYSARDFIEKLEKLRKK